MSEAQIEVGKYVNTFGIKGEIKIFPYVEYFEEKRLKKRFRSNRKIRKKF